jgi:hypothetical protein
MSERLASPGHTEKAPHQRRWLPEEDQLLMDLARSRIAFEDSHEDIEPLGRGATFAWLSEQLRLQGGYHRSAKSVERRLEGRLRFGRVARVDDARSRSASRGATTARPLDGGRGARTRHQHSGSSSSEDTPLSRLRQRVKQGSAAPLAVS